MSTNDSEINSLETGREDEEHDGGEDIVEEDPDGVDADVPLPGEPFGRLQPQIDDEKSCN